MRRQELLLGVEGLAMHRALYDGSDAASARRLTEVRRILAEPQSLERPRAREREPRAGYSEWSHSYDQPGNPIIALEQPAVWALLERAAPGKAQALDAACGTGRHARHLAALGHHVLGVDLTPAMLDHARENVPEARFAQGDLRALPAPDAEFSVVVCGLALSHLAALEEPVRELARVLAPGGELVISVLHPMLTRLGWNAPFKTRTGERCFVREYAHGHAAYLRAFRAAALELIDCQEPTLSVEHVRAKQRAFGQIPQTTIEAYAGLPGVLVWALRKP